MHPAMQPEVALSTPFRKNHLHPLRYLGESGTPSADLYWPCAPSCLAWLRLCSFFLPGAVDGATSKLQYLLATIGLSFL